MRAVRRSALALTALALAAPAALSPAGIASAAPAKPATPAAQLLLTQGEFPAGYEVQKVSPRELSEITDTVGTGINGARVTPAHCAPTLDRAALGRAAGLPIVVAVNEAKRTALSETLSSAGAVDNALRIPAGCENIRIEMNPKPGSADRVVMNATSAPIALPGAPKGARAVFTRATGTVTVDGKDSRFVQEQLIGGEQVRGYAVLLVSTTVSDSGRADRAGFTQALTAATNKVRTAK
ncbi:hypothetical protein HWD35_08485 [Tsukamurella tyrosinosolvens]|uniref:DUF5642 domain-containing protein n=1 Tax=Tsukamurella tyrosinosolvens TaxID=57704 RepID=A0A1H5A5T6_TSUTY|nr:hypothetical protein [Tsukamurella tyrosinosolvens]KXO95433.1 hypothetical protein AXK58_12015 [Tsukamurella tyrosinosolvens]KXP07343.1 hypothetical protein AXK59_04510 [Tsukamurella tyrosinosolvens]KZL98544.1 hypothetical protein AXX05_06660 [Tsukamurella tyrosinosolvens]MCA4994744.1 hypothetical protein [Tsukamurella tyrosinosolvens]SED37622.1 hypothetical protein SAMN04489793_4792 [Tsukamurella tyrosinosolvens]